MSDAGNGRCLLRESGGYGQQRPPGHGLCARAECHVEDGSDVARNGPVKQLQMLKQTVNS